MLKLQATACMCVAVIAATGLSCFAGPVQTYSLNNMDTAPSSNGTGYLFTYESLVQSPGEEGGMVYTDWWYDYYLENNSLNLAIVSWTWSHGAYSGSVMPNSHPDATVADGSSPMPIPKAPDPDLSTAAYREEFFDDPAPYFRVNSRINWSNGYSSVVPIYVPASLVPEPGSLVALSTTLIGFVGVAKRRRR